MKTQQTKHEESGCTDYLQHNWQSCPENKPAPNKAQHSPEWYKNRNQADDLRLCAEIYGRESREFRDMLKRQRETQPDYKAHADKLAEALREACAGHFRSHKVLAALAAYESEVQP